MLFVTFYLFNIFIYMQNLTYLFHFWNYSLIHLGSVFFFPPPNGGCILQPSGGL